MGGELVFGWCDGQVGSLAPFSRTLASSPVPALCASAERVLVELNFRRLQSEWAATSVTSLVGASTLNVGLGNVLSKPCVTQALPLLLATAAGSDFNVTHSFDDGSRGASRDAATTSSLTVCRAVNWISTALPVFSVLLQSHDNQTLIRLITG